MNVIKKEDKLLSSRSALQKAEMSRGNEDSYVVKNIVKNDLFKDFGNIAKQRNWTIIGNQ